jgi:hypothetical protein
VGKFKGHQESNLHSKVNISDAGAKREACLMELSNSKGNSRPITGHQGPRGELEV